MRRQVYQLLTDVEEHQVYLNLRLKQLDLSEDEMKNVTIRTYGIIQNYELLNFYVSELTKGKKVDNRTRRILMMAFYEMKFLNSVPDYAIISEYTKLCKQVNTKAFKYVSYILNNHLGDLEDLKPSFANELKNESITYSHPLWLVKKIAKQYPENYRDILITNNKQKQLTARVVNELIEPEKYNSVQFDDLVVSNNGNLIRSIDFKEGNLIVQDLGSYLVTKLVNPNNEQTVLDLCAAPGNKTMHLASTAKTIVANEINESRYNLLNDNLKKYNCNNVLTINVDAANYEQLSDQLSAINADTKYDKVLIDAPCSGWGVFRSKPESKLYQNAQDIEQIVKIQAEILEVASKFLKEDGELIYSTCTINRDENDKQVTSFMQKNNFAEVRDENLNKYYQDDQVGIALLPQDFDTDGFYMCKMKRI